MLEERPYSFQIKYGEAGQDYTLYIQAGNEGEREDWVVQLRNLVRTNNCLVDRFHPGVWQHSKESCRTIGGHWSSRMVRPGQMHRANGNKSLE